ncbi:pyruvate dehydrogenase kinase [Thamnocephalis sphaerospora]|uniref:Protein-serine/threonine kinase n=1 Tax=Thamnocephalis sphaerospora TaxID=78915 RepID=A0A4P9XQV1_9FUNG|nr:pyruvate dehydrogenase kinase [Thamnocephalis sphaerospora]|eukprot:RKP08443.1 pyruvate dehydrogenase kinase [Thamnocephalis sphaerospora]
MLRIPPKLYEKIKYFATFPQTGVSLRQMVKFGQKPSPGTLFRASQFVADELPIRLAHRVVELENLPNHLSEMPSVIKVKHWYAQSFKDLVEFPRPELSAELRERLRASMVAGQGMQLPEAQPNPATSYYAHSSVAAVTGSNRNGNAASATRTRAYYARMDNVDLPRDILKYNDDFVRCIGAIKRRHDPVVTTMAQGIQEYKEAIGHQLIDTDVQLFLDRFYLSRIGIRMLIGQHIALHQPPPDKDYVGIIGTRTNIRLIAQEAIENARFICEDYYGLFNAPEVQLHCPDDLEFMYVPSHLHHMLFELLKNSLRAVVETVGSDSDDNFPLIKVIVAEGKEDITIKVSDEGGGIPRSGMPMVWTYMYTTAETPELDADYNKSDFKAPMAGFGYGLPLSRLYARYFGGDLKLISMENYGTDAYLHLRRLSDSEEPLP